MYHLSFLFYLFVQLYCENRFEDTSKESSEINMKNDFEVKKRASV